jgi:hypothetical protein
LLAGRVMNSSYFPAFSIVSLLCKEYSNLRGKEVRTMTYVKPEVVVLGDANDLIQATNKSGSGESPSGTSAYDLDE